MIKSRIELAGGLTPSSGLFFPRDHCSHVKISAAVHNLHSSDMAAGARGVMNCEHWIRPVAKGRSQKPWEMQTDYSNSHT